MNNDEIQILVEKFQVICKGYHLDLVDFENLFTVSQEVPGNLEFLSRWSDSWMLPWTEKYLFDVKTRFESLEILVSKRLIKKQLRSSEIFSAPGIPPHEREAGVWYLTGKGSTLLGKSIADLLRLQNQSIGPRQSRVLPVQHIGLEKLHVKDSHFIDNLKQSFVVV